MEEKRIIRLRMRGRAEEQDDRVRDHRHSELAQGHVIGLPEFHVARVVACYAALPGEVRTERIMAEAWKLGHAVAIPAYRADRKSYSLAVLGPQAPVRQGRWGILEPERKEWISVDDVDIAIIPGVAFDVDGGRLGHGGGYYDRLLTSDRTGLVSDVTKIGLAFEWQVVERVPMEAKDVRMNVLVTEERTIRMKQDPESP
jgi:5-formyltetrahydrofolate cyclo-ligase